MAHTHPVHDDDLRFVIDPSTRAITNKAGNRTTIMQGDHNSEILTFEFPRLIEGHDMTLCNVIEVHYDNIGVGTSVSNRQTNSGVYKMTDLAPDTDDDALLTCSWRVTDEATQLYGTIEFSLKFVCYDTDDSPGYVLNTDICKTVDVKQSKNNNAAVYERDPDLYRELDERVSDLETSGIPDADIAAALTDYLNENTVFELDTTLTKSGEAADAEAVGNKIAELEEAIKNAGSDITVDTTMSVSGAAADAKVVGSKFIQLENAIENAQTDVEITNADMSNWYSGTFTMTIDGVVRTGSVEFDSNNRPTSVTLNGHTITFTLPEVE